jgi:hypothetical protein
MNKVKTKHNEHEVSDELMPQLVGMTQGTNLIAIVVIDFWEKLRENGIPEDLSKEITLALFAAVQGQTSDNQAEL